MGPHPRVYVNRPISDGSTKSLGILIPRTFQESSYIGYDWTVKGE